MEIIEDCHGKRSTIFTYQLPVSQWHEVIREKMVADAILNGEAHDAHQVELNGESIRRKEGKMCKQNDAE